MLWRDTHPALHSIALVCCGFFLFSLGDSCSKWLTQYYGVSQILALNSIFAVILGCIWIIKSHGMRGFHSPRWRWHVARAISMTMTAFCIVHTLAYIPLADMYGILFLAPILISALSSLFFKERIGAYRLGALFIGFAGVLIIAGPQFQTMNIGIFYAFASMLSITSNLLLMRKIGDKDRLPLYFLYPFVGNLILNVPLMFFDYTPIEAAHWPLFVILPLLIMVAMMCSALGFARSPETAIVAPFHYTQMIWGILIGMVVFHDMPSWQTLCGAALIIGAGFCVIWREHKKPTIPAAKSQS